MATIGKMQLKSHEGMVVDRDLSSLLKSLGCWLPSQAKIFVLNQVLGDDST